ncbi:hypothetical protein KODAMA_01630 [Serratia phage vB_SmaM-Kodama]|nr:hypothetical protein KODAMA_01630 [Serratia phage vB_SmaM-Kodama]
MNKTNDETKCFKKIKDGVYIVHCKDGLVDALKDFSGEAGYRALSMEKYDVPDTYPSLVTLSVVYYGNHAYKVQYLSLSEVNSAVAEMEPMEQKTYTLTIGVEVKGGSTRISKSFTLSDKIVLSASAIYLKVLDAISNDRSITDGELGLISQPIRTMAINIARNGISSSPESASTETVNLIYFITADRKLTDEQASALKELNDLFDITGN